MCYNNAEVMIVLMSAIYIYKELKCYINAYIIYITNLELNIIA